MIQEYRTLPQRKYVYEAKKIENPTMAVFKLKRPPLDKKVIHWLG